MKFIKANSVLVICGAVVLLALVAIYWPLSFTRAAVVQSATDRLAAAKSISSASVNINIPFGESFNSPPTKEMIKAKQDAQAAMKKQAEQITTDAAKDNQRNRIVGAADCYPLVGRREKGRWQQRATGVARRESVRVAVEVDRRNGSRLAESVLIEVLHRYRLKRDNRLSHISWIVVQHVEVKAELVLICRLAEVLPVGLRDGGR